MVKIVLFYLLAGALLAEEPVAAVTYELSGGRFGDCLISYLHAKWFAYERGIPVVYKSFTHSNQLVLDEEELKTHPCKKGLARSYLGRGEYTPPGRMPPEGILYVCPYFPEDPWELKNTNNLQGNPYYSFPVDWKDPGFRKAALEMIAPKRDVQLAQLREGVVNVALHIRDGGGYDFDDFWTRFPLKLPPFEFYIEGVKAIIDLFPSRKIDFHLFTDAQIPEMVAKRIEEAVNPGPEIKFRYRKAGNHFNRNVIEDFFSLFQFEVMIRPQSNFSMIPTLLQDFAVVYSPKEASVLGKEVRIEEVALEINQELFERLLQR
jgi:hypothetical protein